MIFDEGFGLTAQHYWWKGFELRRDAAVEVSIEVEGDGVDMYLVDQHNFDRFRDAKEKFFGGGRFRHYPTFHRRKAQRVTVEGRLEQGAYYLVVENPTLGLMTETVMDVSLRIVAYP